MIPQMKWCNRCQENIPADFFGTHKCREIKRTEMTAKPEPTDEGLAARFMDWIWEDQWKVWLRNTLEVAEVMNPTREIEAKLAEEGLSQAYADALYGQADKLPRDDDHRIALLGMEIELLLTATDAQRLRAIGAVLRGRGGR